MNLLTVTHAIKYNKQIINYNILFFCYFCRLLKSCHQLFVYKLPDKKTEINYNPLLER